MFDLLPEKVVLTAVSIVAVVVGLDVVRRSYRLHQTRFHHKRLTVDSSSISQEELKQEDRRSECDPSRNSALLETSLDSVPFEEEEPPIQLPTPPTTPPQSLEALRPPSPACAMPQFRPSPDPVPPTPCEPHAFSSTSNHDQPRPEPIPLPTLSPKPSAGKPDAGDPNSVDHTTSTRLPPDLTYTNTSYATLLRAQRLISYEKSRRASLEAEARAQVNATLHVYWNGCKARSWSQRRRSRWGRASGADKEEPSEGEKVRENIETDATKENLKYLQLGTQRLREESVPYEDVLCPPCPHSRLPYSFEHGRLFTPRSAYISPSYLLVLLSDTTMASSVEEIDVSLGLWAGWEWDVEVEWELERIAHGSTGGRDLAVNTKIPGLPKLKKLTISTSDVPLGPIFERMALAPGSLENVCIHIGDGAAPLTSPGSRSSGQRLKEARTKSSPSERVATCLTGLDSILERVAREVEVHGSRTLAAGCVAE